MQNFTGSTESIPGADGDSLRGKTLDGYAGLFPIFFQNLPQSWGPSLSEFGFPDSVSGPSRDESWSGPHGQTPEFSSARNSLNTQSRFSYGCATMGCDADLRIGAPINLEQLTKTPSHPFTLAETVQSGDGKSQANLFATSRTRRTFPAADVLWDRVPA